MRERETREHGQGQWQDDRHGARSEYDAMREGGRRGRGAEYQPGYSASMGGQSRGAQPYGAESYAGASPGSSDDELPYGASQASQWRAGRDDDYGPRRDRGYPGAGASWQRSQERYPGSEGYGGGEYAQGRESRGGPWRGGSGEADADAGPGYGNDYGSGYGNAYGQPQRGLGSASWQGGRGQAGSHYGQGYGQGPGPQAGRGPRGGFDDGEYASGGAGYGQERGFGEGYGRSSGYGEEQGYGHGRSGVAQARGQEPRPYGYGPGGPSAGGLGDRVIQSQYRGRGPRDYRRSNERILEDINERLTDDSLLDASDISVRCVDGRVTLEGEVDDRWMKHRAEDVVDGCRGVQEIDNRLRVRGSQGMGAGSSRGASPAYRDEETGGRPAGAGSTAAKDEPRAGSKGGPTGASSSSPSSSTTPGSSH